MKKTIIKIIIILTIILVPLYMYNTYQKEQENNIKQVQKYISTSLNTLKIEDYNKILSSIKNINNDSIKKELNEEINKIKDYIDIKNEIENLSNNYNIDEYNTLISKVNNIDNKTIKEEFTKELNTIKEDNEMDGWILIGDSRFVSFKSFNNRSDVYIIAEVGKSYSWFINTAYYEVNKILENNPDKKYYIYSNLGVNGLQNKYANKLNELANNEWSKHKVGYISINPYVGNSSTSVSKNKKIKELNEDQKSKLNNVYYCDTYNGIGESNFTSSGDILHYNKKTNMNIYNYILSNCEF